MKTRRFGTTLGPLLVAAALLACQDQAGQAPSETSSSSTRDNPSSTNGSSEGAPTRSQTGPTQNNTRDKSTSSETSPDSEIPDTGSAGAWSDLPLSSTITRVQPMTGIVLWENAWNDHKVKQSHAISMEYAYVSPASLTNPDGSYNWQQLDSLLDRVAGRKHQSIIRFYYTYPGRATEVPAHVKAQAGYEESSGIVEGKSTGFPDWSHSGLETFHLDFFKAFAARYDKDPRLAFLQVGFGLWGEYHIYEGPKVIGKQFPTHDFQTKFLRALHTQLPTLRWSFSIDAGDSYYSPVSSDSSLLKLDFGNFDDSFMVESHDDYNARMWRALQFETRYTKAPAGGELSYMTDFDQENALRAEGIHGRTYGSLSKRYHITYMIGSDQPSYHSVETIKAAGMQNGYRFRVTGYKSNGKQTKVTVTNEGIAPFYYDAYFYLGDVAGQPSLRGLLPGASIEVTLDQIPNNLALTIQSPRIVSGQRIEFAADL